MANDFIAARVVEMQTSRYVAAERRIVDLIAYYDVVMVEITDEIAKVQAQIASGAYTTSDLYNLNRWNDVLAQIERSKAQLYGQTQMIFGDVLRDVIDMTNEDITSLFGLEHFTFNEELVEAMLDYPWSGANYSTRIWENVSALARDLRQTILRGAVRGSSVSTIVSDLRERVSAEDWKLRRLVRSEVAFFENEVAKIRYRDADFTALEYLAIEDNRTCEICMPLDGKVYDIDDVPYLPQHPNCRCTVIPYIGEDMNLADYANARPEHFESED